MWIYYLVEFLLYVGVDVDVIHTVRHFPLTRYCLRPAAQKQSHTQRKKETEMGEGGDAQDILYR